MEPRLFDAHCHLDLMAHPDAVADEATTLGLILFDCGVDPHDFARAKKRACGRSNIFAGIGLHPWWLADGRCGNAEINLLCEVAAQERYIGEVGLDFSARFAGSEPLQAQAFDRLCDALAQHPLAGRVISIHAVRSAGTVLNVLESHAPLIPNSDSPLSSSTGLAVLRTNSPARVMRAVIFPSTNACSRPNEDANTHDRFHSTVYCSRPMRRPSQTQKQARSRSSNRSQGYRCALPHSKTVTQSASSR